MTRGRKRRDERGAAAVEAALVTPLIFLLVFGVIEMAFLSKDYISVASSVRAGARMASAAPSAGPAVNDGTVPNANPATTPRFAQLTAEAMRTTGTALNSNQIEEIWIYEATDAGFPLGSTSMEDADCAQNCVRFTWSEARDDFRHDSSSEWEEVALSSCATEGSRVGVNMIASHAFVTGMFGDIEMSDHSVMTFEPLTFEDGCS